MKDCFYPHCTSWELRHTEMSAKYEVFSEYFVTYNTDGNAQGFRRIDPGAASQVSRKQQTCILVTPHENLVLS